MRIFFVMMVKKCCLMFVKVLYFYQICKRFRDGPFVPEFLPPLLFLFFPGEDSLFLATAVVFQ